MESTSPADLLTLAEAAAARRCSLSTLRRDIAAGRLAVVRQGPRRVFVTRAELARRRAEDSAKPAP